MGNKIYLSYLHHHDIQYSELGTIENAATGGERPCILHKVSIKLSKLRVILPVAIFTRTMYHPAKIVVIIGLLLVMMIRNWN